MQDHARSQRPRRKQQGIKLETPQRAEYLSLAAVAKCLQAITWLVARGNKKSCVSSFFLYLNPLFRQ